VSDRLPLLFILGPSGSGKSALAEWIAADLGLLHLETDIWGKDGIYVQRLRREWHSSWSGAVLTFPSVLVPRRQHRQAAFLRREADSGRGL